jgi:hypothetical protein
MTRRSGLTLGLVITLSLIGAPLAAAHDNDRDRSQDSRGVSGERDRGSLKNRGNLNLPTRIDLPDGFGPEGITASFAGRLYVGSVANGAIWRGSAKSGEGSILVEGATGRQAAGLHLDWRGRLWVAGANNHTIRVYNAASGALLQTYEFPTAGFINDLAITRRGVYATDSNNQQLAVVPFGKHGALPAPSAATLLPLTGDLSYSAGFNANGIVAMGRWLILVQSNEGLLFRVDPKTGATEQIDTAGYSVTAGDGLALRKNRLYVVRNQVNLVAVLNLKSDALSASLVGEITSAGNLDVPTTATFAFDKLYVVNARFGNPTPTTADYWITRLPTSP